MLTLDLDGGGGQGRRPCAYAAMVVNLWRSREP